MSYTLSTVDGRFMWHVTMKAANLVPDTGTAPLPLPKGNLRTVRLNDPARFGLNPQQDPLLQMYPNLDIEHMLLPIDPHFMVSRDGINGVAVYVDHNGSGLSASVTSEGGRNPLAPWDWTVKPGSWRGQTWDPNQTPFEDPTAYPRMEYRQGPNGQTWQSFMVHGWDHFGHMRGMDWRDGVPVSLDTMHDLSRGEVRQSIWVPKMVTGLGTAEQTLRAEDVNDTYTIIIWFPRHEAEGYALMRESYGYGGNMRVGGGYLGTAKGGFDDSTLESYGGATTRSLGGDRGGPTVEAEFKMAGGGLIRQPIIPCPFSLGYWNSVPAAAFRLYPVSVELANKVEHGTYAGRQTF